MKKADSCLGIKGALSWFSAFRFVLIVLLVVLPPVSVFSQRAPLWYLDLEAEYPSDKYIAAIGEGKTRKEAEDAAVSNLALFFQTQTNIRNDMMREYNEAIRNGESDFQQDTRIVQSAQITSQAEFLGVNFASLYQDSYGEFSALAYIDRQEIIRIYDTKIQFNLSLLKSLLDSCGSNSDPIVVSGKVRKGQAIYRVIDEYVKMAVIVNPDAAARYAEVPPLQRRMDDLLSSCRPRLTIRVVCDPAHQRIGRKLGEIMQSLGFTMKDRGSEYIINLAVSTSEEVTPNVLFVRSGIEAKITSAANGRVIFSYTKNLPRYGHSTWDGAYSRAYLNIEKDLEENFLREFNTTFGY